MRPSRRSPRSSPNRAASKALYLYATAHPELQEIIRRARNEFVTRLAAALPCANPEAVARMVVAMIDGLLLDQISAPEDVVEQYASMFVLAAGAAGMQLPAAGA